MLSLAACGKNEKNQVKDSQATQTPGNQVEDNQATQTPGEVTSGNVEVTLGQYKGIEVTLESTEVTDEEIQGILTSFNQAYGTPIKLTDRSDVQTGDTVNIDYEGKIDGVAFEGGTAKASDLTIGSGQFIDGFEDGLVGKNVGETVDVTTKFPDNYTNTEVAGKEAIFTVTINYIHSGEYEPLTDEIVAANDTSGNKTVAELTEFISSNLKTNKEQTANTSKEIDIITKAIENATYTNLEQSEFDQNEASMLNYYTAEASQYGIDLETYVYYFFSGLPLDQFKTELKKAAEFNVRQSYLLEEVAKQEKIEVSDEEYEELLVQYMEDYQYAETEKEQFVTDMGGKESLQKAMVLEKAMDLIINSAVVTE